ncbi:hypothetical protein N658DRAFT_499220 [Parathielavia hyrcaniae]|uniref:Uncharacterized protein n=1 Tax=Parathielavia hyrcaniae TaxID=113614 RepID=A0AAN6Q057_9PEZI|nr:hypothetical protein N658DRAFT_499220 [Parathielavia hyrcaniae]
MLLSAQRVLCDLIFHFQGVAALRSYCAACWRPKSSISRIRSEVSERPEIPHHPARQPRLTDTNDKNKLQQTSQDQGDTGRDRAPPALPSSGRAKSRVLAANPTELLIDRGEGR